MKENKIWLATGNSHKVKEARIVLAEYGIELEHIEVDRIEIQSDDPGEIAVYSLTQLADDERPITIEDAGLFLDHYGGFPGPYSSYALEKLDNPGILKLMDKVEDRGAAYHSYVGFRSGEEIHVFQGTVTGKVAVEMRGTNGFGYDPIFYVPRLKKAIEKLSGFPHPDIAVVVSGVDAYEKDELPSTAKLKLSKEQLRSRDRFVYKFLEKKGIAMAYLTSGGYGKSSWEIYNDFIPWILLRRLDRRERL